jgi:hypothetical protein
MNVKEKRRMDNPLDIGNIGNKTQNDDKPSTSIKNNLGINLGAREG